jgi:ATP-dependent DNA ligase
LASLPDNTAVDGEIVALDETGKPSFNALQNYGNSKADLVFYIFDVMVLGGKDVMFEPLAKRRDLLEEKVLTKLAEPIRYSPALEASLADLIHSVKAQGFEGLVAKRRDSKYQPGLRTGAWQKMRVNQGQELVIAGYTPSSKNFDALVIGYYKDGKLIYAARTRNGFTPASRAELFKKLKPFGNGRMPVREPSGEEGRTLGCWAHGGEDEGVPVAKAEAGGAVRVCRVDGCEPPAAYKVHCSAGRQESKGCDEGRVIRRPVD